MLLTVTESAKDYLTNMTKQHEKRYVNLAVKGGGCSGFQYEWTFTDEPEGPVIDDILSLDPMAEMFIIGSQIDYVNELGGSYLKIVNPMQTSSCGCGASFGV